MLDVSSHLDIKKDLQFVETDKYRSYNLLTRFFQDNRFIRLNIIDMISDGISPGQIQMSILSYLGSFFVNFSDFYVEVSDKGVVKFDFNFNIIG